MRKLNRRRGVGGIVAVIMIVVGVVVGLVLPFLAEGAPSAPTAQLQTTLDPTTAQTLTITVYTAAYSTQPINSIDQQGAKIVWSLSQSGTTRLVDQQAAVNIIGASGFQSHLAATITPTVPAICSQSACNTETITLTVYAVVPSWTGTYLSPVSVINFTSGGSSGTNNINPAPTGQFYFNFLGAIVGFIALELLIGGLIPGPHRLAVWILAIILTIAVVAMYVDWVWLPANPTATTLGLLYGWASSR